MQNQLYILRETFCDIGCFCVFALHPIQVHLPLAFKKGAGLVCCIADGVIGYNPEAMQNTWKVCSVSGLHY